jgi:hypothetical protein
MQILRQLGLEREATEIGLPPEPRRRISSPAPRSPSGGRIGSPPAVVKLREPGCVQLR